MLGHFVRDLHISDRRCIETLGKSRRCAGRFKPCLACDPVRLVDKLLELHELLFGELGIVVPDPALGYGHWVQVF